MGQEMSVLPEPTTTSGVPRPVSRNLMDRFNESRLAGFDIFERVQLCRSPTEIQIAADVFGYWARTEMSSSAIVFLGTEASVVRPLSCAQVTSWDRPPSRITQSWLVPVLHELAELTRLPDNWDHRSSPKVSEEEIETALKVLLRVMPEDGPVPRITPTRRGGVQLGWYGGGIDVELICDPNEAVYGAFTDEVIGQDWEGDLYGNVPRVSEAIRLVGERHSPVDA